MSSAAKNLAAASDRERRVERKNVPDMRGRRFTLTADTGYHKRLWTCTNYDGDTVAGKTLLGEKDVFYLMQIAWEKEKGHGREG
jgi:hypothetical protein